MSLSCCDDAPSRAAPRAKRRVVAKLECPRACPLGGLALLALLARSAAAAELVTAQPHEFVLGPSPGYAVTAGVDPAHSRHSAELLPTAEVARVLWQRQIPGGIGCNALVDGDGRVFIAGPGRVTQLAPDGALQFSQTEGFASPAAAALLADGTRAVLTQDGRVLGWSPSGVIAFDVALEAATASSASSLVPVPDGGVLASVGRWLFEIDATRSVRAHTALPAPAQHTLLAGARAVVIDEQGRVFEWDRHEPLRPVGAFGGPIAASLIDAGGLIALGSRRSLQRMDRANGSVHELARFDASSLAPTLGWLASQRWLLMKYDGSWFTIEHGVAPAALGGRAEPPASSGLELLVDASGAVAWWASEAALHLETAPGVGHELADVRCSVPANLAPAGRGRLLAACGSGLVWLIGPPAVPGTAGEATLRSEAREIERLPIGSSDEKALYSTSLSTPGTAP